MQKFPHTLIKYLASYEICQCIDNFAIFWKNVYFGNFFIKNISPCLSSRYKQRANAIVTKSHAINIFFHAHSAAVSKWGKAIYYSRIIGPKPKSHNLHSFSRNFPVLPSFFGFLDCQLEKVMKCCFLSSFVPFYLILFMQF